MKTFLKTMALMLVLTGFSACTPDEDLTPQSLEVTYNNVSGVWALSEVNGERLPEELYCYIDFVRKDRTYTMYQKFDSMYPRRITGSFTITEDEYKGYILDGKYYYGTGDWNNAYIVKNLLEESMLLVADSENGAVYRYVRCNEVPADILNYFGTEE